MPRAAFSLFLPPLRASLSPCLELKAATRFGARPLHSRPIRWQTSVRATMAVPHPGTHALLLTNALIHLLRRFAPVPPLAALHLNHFSPRPEQLVTSLFLHRSLPHLLATLLPLLYFGRLIEDKFGSATVLATYILCGALANAASVAAFSAKGVVSLGGNGAVFGVFLLGLLSSFEYSKSMLTLGWWTEMGVWAFFVVCNVYRECLTSALKKFRRGGSSSFHIAKMGGVGIGVLLLVAVLLLRSAMKSGAKRSLSVEDRKARYYKGRS